ncbi:hypothetical protein [Dokdonella soli]|uniref:Uncharacterized protein n=1 Tax=Dokdonella soli TaxID=529810 RepID=A0ABP3TWF2_9GAMM
MQRNRWRSLAMACRFLLALARYQMQRWRETVSYKMRCVLAFVCTLLALLPSYVFGQLPKGWLDLLLDHLYTPQGAFIVIVLLYLAALNFTFGLVSYKVARTL